MKKSNSVPHPEPRCPQCGDDGEVYEYNLGDGTTEIACANCGWPDEDFDAPDGLPACKECAAKDAELARLRKGAPMTNGAVDVLVERRRQITNECWDDDHDDEHEAGDLARAGAAYAIQAAGGNGERLWPFVDYWKPSDTRSNLVKAAALIIAEIDKHDRAENEGGE